MKHFWILMFLVLTSLCHAQRPGFAIGAGYGGAFGVNESIEHPLGSNFRFSLLYLRGLSPVLSLELGGGHATLASGEKETVNKYETSVIPLDIRFRYSPRRTSQWSPYVFGGLGIALFNVTIVPPNKDPKADTAGGNLYVTGGAGLFHAFDPHWAVDVSIGASTTLEDDLNPAHDDRSDGWWFGTIGVHYLFNAQPKDTDDDGLPDAEEATYRTDLNDPDSDDDGLTDGAEVYEYKTSPHTFDTDGDGVSDGHEALVLTTDPRNTDTDGDGITDGQEFNTYNSNPLNKDTDADGLPDNDEINKYHTKPFAIDSDGDGLSDGNEILKHHTDALGKDTDKGGVTDGDEVRKGTNPLSAKDDK